MWYLILKMERGTLDLSTFNLFYSRKAIAEEQAALARKNPGTIDVQICRK